jgi:hypothetical protein
MGPAIFLIIFLVIALITYTIKFVCRSISLLSGKKKHQRV